MAFHIQDMKFLWLVKIGEFSCRSNPVILDIIHVVVVARDCIPEREMGYNTMDRTALSTGYITPSCQRFVISYAWASVSGQLAQPHSIRIILTVAARLSQQVYNLDTANHTT